MELVTIAANPQVPPEVKTTAQKIATAAGEIIERTIRTFDQIRDPRTFIVDVGEELDSALACVNQNGLQGLSQLPAGLSGPQNGAHPVGAGGADMGGNPAGQG